MVPLVWEAGCVWPKPRSARLPDRRKVMAPSGASSKPVKRRNLVTDQGKVAKVADIVTIVVARGYVMVALDPDFTAVAGDVLNQGAGTNSASGLCAG